MRSTVRVRDIVAQAAARAASLLEGHRDLLERGANALLDRETLTVADLQALVAASAVKPKLAVAAGGRG